MSPGQYREILKVAQFDRIQALQNKIDKIADQVNEQALHSSYNVANDFEEDIKSLETLMSKTENVFTSISPEEQVTIDSGSQTSDRVTSSIEF